MLVNGGVGLPNIEYQFTPKDQVEVCKKRECAVCHRDFYRIQSKELRLKDGSTIDPNLLCPSCEITIVREADTRVKRRKDACDRKLTLREQYERQRDRNYMESRCLRKEAYLSYDSAYRVANSMRSRKTTYTKTKRANHRAIRGGSGVSRGSKSNGADGGSRVIDVYRCTIRLRHELLTPEELASHGGNHWHVGGRDKFDAE
jgi:hypothetical protein